MTEKLKADLLRARNPSTGEALLLELSQSPEEEVRRAVALNPNCPEKILLALAQDSSRKVLVAVAYSRKAPPEALLLLAQNPDPRVRLGVAANPSAPLEALLVLAKDLHYWISEVAVRQLLLRLSELPPPEKDPVPWIKVWKVLPKEDKDQLQAFEGGDMAVVLAQLEELFG